MNAKELRNFFVNKMNKLLDLEELSKNMGSYWTLTTLDSRKFYNTNLILIDKIDLSEVWESIPTPLKIDLEIFYNYAVNNITFQELKKRINKPLSIFFICVDYGCYLFYQNYKAKFERRNNDDF